MKYLIVVALAFSALAVESHTGENVPQVRPPARELAVLGPAIVFEEPSTDVR